MRHGEGFFIVLPDLIDSFAVASRLSASELKRISYPSGNTFVLGLWDDHELSLTKTRDGIVALIGAHTRSSATVDAVERTALGLQSADELALSVAGSYHLVSWDGRRLRVQGTASGMRRMYYGITDGVVVACNRADVLASLCGASLNDEQLALRLMDYVPYPLDTVPMWHGIEAVPPGSYLDVRPNGRSATIHCWWSPPDPVVSISEGAADLRRALQDAIAARVGQGTVSCDLSGGLDSTPLCYLIAAATRGFVARTIASRDPADDDMAWALRAAASMDGIDHVIISPDELPLSYSGVVVPAVPVDEPAPTLLDLSRQFVGFDRLSGAVVHITGNGGDHLFTPPLAHCRDELKRHPFVAIRHLRAHRIQEKWPIRTAIVELLRNESYAKWLARAARGVRRKTSFSTHQLLGWDIAPQMPPWASDDAREIAAVGLREASRHLPALSRRRGVHADVAMIQFGTRTARILHQLSEANGLPMQSPYFDDRVIEASLAVKPLERASPWEFKTIIKEAMRDIVEPSLLTRQTKGNGDSDKIGGLRTYSENVAALWTSSELARRGLIENVQLADRLNQPGGPDFGIDQVALLDTTLACELWLRSQTHRPARRGEAIDHAHT
ncbi:asparagine synthase-related protein [Nocardia sp. NPDC004068]|uniref:asparagine synthase-related protein n=1 Tax=Nocardia sp. NPDC004068 TaxID=3364303 RepID=UPI003679C028